MTKIGGSDNFTQAQDLLRTALDVADKYFGSDQQQLIDTLNRALQRAIFRLENDS
jgi:hypothetical protein